MSDRDYAPLSLACVRALIDKQYDKRKAAASEIEKMAKEFVIVNNTGQIRKLLKVLGYEFTMSQNPNFRKGGLIGLAAVAIALGKDSSEYVEALIRPILTNFSDNDSRIRYYACESLYNVVKVARGAVLPYFTEIFKNLSKLAADHDQAVKNGSEHLDRLLKDIVTENATFDLVAFMPHLRERLYSKNTFSRQYIISWVSVLHAVPEIELILFLPDILDGLFNMLSDQNIEIKKMCETVLKEFLRSINKDPTRADFNLMINVLILHAQMHDELLQYTSLTWIHDFICLSKKVMLPYTSGILSAILPCLAYEGESKKRLKEVAEKVNTLLMGLIDTSIDMTEEGDNQQLDLHSVLEVLTKQSIHTSVKTIIASLKWIYHLHTGIPKKMELEMETVFPILLCSLKDQADDVVQHAIYVLAQFVSPKEGGPEHSEPSPYFTRVLVSLLNLFRRDRQALEDRGSFIIRQLCVLLNAEEIYKSIAKILKTETDLKFARVMVDTLNTILLTSSELLNLRNRLKTEGSELLFKTLYETWCHNPVATIALCLLTQNYAHVANLITTLSNYEVNVEFLAEVDRLVQLLESPIFIYLRLQLLQTPENYYLIRAMYGLLMLLPQSEAFHVLRHRLDCIPRHINCIQRSDVTFEDGNKFKSMNFNELLEHFQQIQDNHAHQRLSERSDALFKTNVKMLNP
ncbi:protein VAC14 homolog isoform X1 [Halyomorpha halys]|uniref:protein VAC14 homolog isoform X1 n=1 Tax=Halyomorpha halys TaxID=286706 RepID=UPI0006D4DFAA|nr:protein VAC14 homolog isoform X1 [Halyomorpha halys]